MLAACSPATQSSSSQKLEATPADDATFNGLAAPFADALRNLGIVITSGQAFRYAGNDPNAFIQAINEFYITNPGFCPLEQAFYPAASGVQFMTLAGRNTTEIRGFLYDQSQKPRLTYAYFEGTASQVFSATVCETAAP